VAANTELIVEPYNVVDKLEFPALERFVPGSADGYDVLMLTGSSECFLL
jgi:hypothetical protein